MSFTGEVPIIAQGLPISFRDQTIWRDPESFSGSYILNVDFDETCFTTHISKTDGVEVREAYMRAVRSVLGADAEIEYTGTGGLSNRAPLDVTIGLIQSEPKFAHHALEYAQEKFAHPDDISDIGLGIIARFARRGRVDPDELTIRAVTEMLVIDKKEILIPQISAEWPLPLKGFDEFWFALHEWRQQAGLEGVHTAIVSSGHTDFIQLTMEQGGLPHPDIYMTDDEMRRQVRPRTKPNPMALELVENAWMDAYLVSPEARADTGFLFDARGRQLYIGDDVDKDGDMAANHGIHFELFENDPNCWPRIGTYIMRTIEDGGRFGGQE